MFKKIMLFIMVSFALGVAYYKLGGPSEQLRIEKDQQPLIVSKTGYVATMDLNRGDVISLGNNVVEFEVGLTESALTTLSDHTALLTEYKKGELLKPNSVVEPTESNYFNVVAKGRSVLNTTMLNDFSKKTNQAEKFMQINNIKQGDLVDVIIIRESTDANYDSQHVINLLLSKQLVLWNAPLPNEEQQEQVDETKETSLADDASEESTQPEAQLLLALDETDLMKYLLAEKGAVDIYIAKHTKDDLTEQLDLNAIYAIKRKQVYRATHIKQYH